MRNLFKRISLMFVVCLSLITCCSCSLLTKTYEFDEFSITMSRGFKEDTYEDAEVYLEKRDILFIAYEDKLKYSYAPDVTVNEYARLLLIENMISSEIQERDNEEYAYFTYTKNISGDDIFYMTTVHKTEEAFWIIDFMCFEDKKNEFSSKFLKWSDSIVFKADLLSE